MLPDGLAVGTVKVVLTWAIVFPAGAVAT
jgi:hypothetical protein